MSQRCSNVGPFKNSQGVSITCTKSTGHSARHWNHPYSKGWPNALDMSEAAKAERIRDRCNNEAPAVWSSETGKRHCILMVDHPGVLHLAGTPGDTSAWYETSTQMYPACGSRFTSAGVGENHECICGGLKPHPGINCLCAVCNNTWNDPGPPSMPAPVSAPTIPRVGGQRQDGMWGRPPALEHNPTKRCKAMPHVWQNGHRHECDAGQGHEGAHVCRSSMHNSAERWAGDDQKNGKRFKGKKKSTAIIIEPENIQPAVRKAIEAHQLDLKMQTLEAEWWCTCGGDLGTSEGLKSHIINNIADEIYKARNTDD